MTGLYVDRYDRARALVRDVDILRGRERRHGHLRGRLRHILWMCGCRGKKGDRWKQQEDESEEEEEVRASSNIDWNEKRSMMKMISRKLPQAL